MTFEAFDESLRLVRLLRPLLSRLRSRDPDLHRQLRKAASSSSLNLAEGAGHEGRDRRHHYRIARGSVLETEAILRVAEAWGDLEAREMAPAMTSVKRLLRLTWGLTR